MKTSIKGIIIQEDEPRKVNVKGEDVGIKQITVKDQTGKVKVTLWRETADAEVRPGDFVTITYVVINVYQNTTSLSTTQKSKVEKREAPVMTRKIMVQAIGVDNSVAELFIDDDDCVSMQVTLLEAALDCPDVEMATADGPLHLTVSTKGSEVISVKKM